MNAKSLIEFQRHWHEQKILDISKFSITIMITPAFLTLRVLPYHHKQRLSKLMLDHINWCISKNAIGLATQWENAVKYMLDQDDSHHLEEFQKVTKNLDYHRQESFALVFPEYCDLL
jgi:hypothetical protein